MVIGEYTIASLLGNYQNLQVVIVLIGKTDGATSVAASLMTLLFGFVLLGALSLFTRGRRRGARAGREDPAAVAALTTPQMQGGA